MNLTLNPTEHKMTSPVATRRVNDAATRTFHWLFAFSFIGAYLTADFERLRGVHVNVILDQLKLFKF